MRIAQYTRAEAHALEALWASRMEQVARVEQVITLTPAQIKRAERRNMIVDFLRAEGPQWLRHIEQHVRDNGAGVGTTAILNDLSELRAAGRVQRIPAMHRNQQLNQWEAVN